MKAGEGEGREERNLKPAARCLAAIREVNRTCTGVSHTATEHKSKQIITRWHGEAVAPAASPQPALLGTLVAPRERAGGGRGAAPGLGSPRGQSQEETDADKSPDSHAASRRFWQWIQAVQTLAGP